MNDHYIFGVVQVKNNKIERVRVDAHNGSYEEFPTRVRIKTKWEELKEWKPGLDPENGLYPFRLKDGISTVTVIEGEEATTFLDKYYHAAKSNSTKDELTEWM